ncbi:hypothetical protein NSU18_18670 [Paenibacillus sp. FSL H8-0048]|uniref:hypothetical protein n=1 Tax=Paenibacillus sp. FSL H8-0048 TaxID=2954508 RepID=UPI0030F785FD
MELFQCKTYPLNVEDKFNEFVTGGFIAIGYPGLDDLCGLNKQEIRERLERVYHENPARTRYHLGMVNAFCNSMSPGDFVLIEDRNNGNVHVGVLGAYSFKGNLDDVGLSHQRSVDWKAVIPRSELTTELKEFIRNRPSITQFKHPIEVAKLERYLNQQPATLGAETNELLSKALSILSEEMDSKDTERKIRAAIALLQYLKS